MTESRLGAEKRDFHRRFQRQTGRNYFAINAFQGVVRERTGIFAEQPLVDLALTARNVKIEIAARLKPADIKHDLRPLIQQVEYGIINTVDT